jgi:hypothetical protein
MPQIHSPRRKRHVNFLPPLPYDRESIRISAADAAVDKLAAAKETIAEALAIISFIGVGIGFRLYYKSPSMLLSLRAATSGSVGVQFSRIYTLQA